MILLKLIEERKRNHEHPTLPHLYGRRILADSYFSVARYCGGIQMNQYSYKIVNKEGITIFELSDPENEHYVGDGDEQAIKPGEPADLVREDFIPYYKSLGRDVFIKVLEENQRKSDTEIKKIYEEMIKKKK